MIKKVFIQSNNSQRLGALLSKYSIERLLKNRADISVHILQVEDIPAFQKFAGKTYKHGNEERPYSLSDEQSFTLTRFMGPKEAGYEGRAIAIDPDVFVVQDISPLFDLDMEGKPAACCFRDEGRFWDTSVLLTDNEKLDWDIDTILGQLAEQEINYNTAMRKVFDVPLYTLPRIWNSLDRINDETKMVHMTRQRTQPWKTGLPFEVTKRKMGKIFGIIPKEWLPSAREKYPSHYQEHPDSRVKAFFFGLVKSALEDGVVKKEDIQKEVDTGHIRPDIFEMVEHAKRL